MTPQAPSWRWCSAACRDERSQRPYHDMQSKAFYESGIGIIGHTITCRILAARLKLPRKCLTVYMCLRLTPPPASERCISSCRHPAEEGKSCKSW